MNDYLTRTDTFIASLGLEAYRVGGSVRDEILGRRVKDADYMVRGVHLEALGDYLTGAALGRGKTGIARIRDRKRRPLGWRVTSPGLGTIEITLPRREISTGPAHTDFDIVLDPELGLHEDALRRDFTFNALYRQITPDGPGVVADPTSTGLYDLQHRLVRTTYTTSFRDDPLRTLRALRFVSVLGYDLTAETISQMGEHADAVNGLTASGNMSGTVFDEMSKLLMGDDPAKALRYAARLGVLGTLFPELAGIIRHNPESRYHDLTTDEHTFRALGTAAKCDAPLRVRWALLFHDTGKPEVEWIGDDGRKHYYARKGVLRDDGKLNEDHEVASERLWREAAKAMNVPARLREDVAVLVRNHMVSVSGKVKASKVNRERVRLGDEMLRDLHMHRMCDLAAKDKSNRNHIVHVARLEDERRAAQAAGIPASTKALQITGKDAIALDITGRWIGGALDVVLDDVVAQPNATKLSREWQLARLESIAKHRKRMDELIEGTS